MTLMRCVIEGDDFERIFEKWKAADVLIVGAPVYWYAPPGALKDFMDRTHGEYACEALPFAGKKAAVVSVATESGFEVQEQILLGWLRHYGAEVAGTVRLRAREKGDLASDPIERKKLDSFIAELKAALG
jgi:multimeric flavodoxin WrbA